jgi:rhodanese-related sulfurtransferase
MAELIRTRRLTIASIFFVLIIIIGFLTFKTPAFNYKLSVQQTVEELLSPENIIYPEEAKQIISSGNSHYVFVDLRNPYEYSVGHPENALNIPVSDITGGENISFFKDMKERQITVILFGNDLHEANKPWMWLRQIGFDNTKMLYGGYIYLLNSGSVNVVMQSYAVEKQDFDYSIFQKGNSSSSVASPIINKEKKNQLDTVKREKKTATMGGC